MVTFQEDGYTITVKTNVNPIDEWLETHNQLIDVLQCQDSEMLSNNFHVFGLIREMMPDWQTAKKMTE